MTTRGPACEDRSWEKEHAPVVSRRYLVFVCILFAAWLVVLGYMAAQRWLGALQ